MRRSTIIMICTALCVVAVSIGLLVGLLVGPRTAAVAYETAVPTSPELTAAPAQPAATPLTDTPPPVVSPTAASGPPVLSPTTNIVDTAAPTATPPVLSEPSAVLTQTTTALASA